MLVGVDVGALVAVGTGAGVTVGVPVGLAVGVGVDVLVVVASTITSGPVASAGADSARKMSLQAGKTSKAKNNRSHLALCCNLALNLVVSTIIDPTPIGGGYPPADCL